MVVCVNVTQKCVVSGKHGFELTNSNRFLIVEVEAKNGDLIKVNNVIGVKYSEIWDAVEQPTHEERPIIDNLNKVVVIGGELNKSKRILCIIGK